MHTRLKFSAGVYMMLLSAALSSATLFLSCEGNDGEGAGSNSKPPAPPPSPPVVYLPSTEKPTEGKAMADGGSMSFVQSGDYWDEVHVFTTDGTLTVTRAPDAGTVKVLVVAGGGGGGKGDAAHHAGGGGAGGLVMENTLSLTSSEYTVTVGAGGPGGSLSGYAGYDTLKLAVQSYNGKDSGITGEGVDILAYGGGGAGWHLDYNAIGGGDGGSGGAGYILDTGGGNGYEGQGYKGATLDPGASTGGGGGAAGPGIMVASYVPGTGGPGLVQADIPAAAGVTIRPDHPAHFASGGGGGSNVAGADNTGDGGGGGYVSNGWAGGSGIVIVRFPHTTASPTVSPVN